MSWKKGTIAGAAAALVFVGAGAASCDKTNEPFKDAARSGNNNAPAETGTMPDGFSNWAAKCDGPNMVYVIFKSNSNYGAISVVKDDPRCTGH